jgi:hypothetical protein
MKRRLKNESSEGSKTKCYKTVVRRPVRSLKKEICTMENRRKIEITKMLLDINSRRYNQERKSVQV